MTNKLNLLLVVLLLVGAFMPHTRRVHQIGHIGINVEEDWYWNYMVGFSKATRVPCAHMYKDETAGWWVEMPYHGAVGEFVFDTRAQAEHWAETECPSWGGPWRETSFSE